MFLSDHEAMPGQKRGQDPEATRSRKWRKYSLEDFQAAIDEIRAGASIGATAKKWGIPKQTLHDNKNKERLRAPHPGRALTEEEEEGFVQFILWMADHGFPLTRSLIKVYARGIIKQAGRNPANLNLDKGLSEMWWQRFKQRHPELTLRTTDCLDR